MSHAVLYFLRSDHFWLLEMHVHSSTVALVSDISGLHAMNVALFTVAQQPSYYSHLSVLDSMHTFIKAARMDAKHLEVPNTLNTLLLE